MNETTRIRLIELPEDADEQLRIEAALDGMTPEEKAREILLDELADEELADEDSV